MPTITLLKKPRKEESPKRQTDQRKLRAKAYNNTAWRALRNTYLKEHPLCANCLSKGIVTAGEDIHHKNSPFKTGEINYTLLLDYNNLETLCKKCHSEEHTKTIKTEDVINNLEKLLEGIDDED